MSQHPRFGFTRAGLPVHARTADHHNAGKVSKAIARVLTRYVGSMGCFWVFNVLALLSLPATFHLMGLKFIDRAGIPSFFLTYGWIFLITWICQNYIQLVLLPALMVGQNLQAEASDARAAKQFEDTEIIVDRLDETTEGGVKAVLDAIAAQDGKILAILGRLAIDGDAQKSATLSMGNFHGEPT